MAGYLDTIGMRSGVRAVGRIAAAVIGLCALTGGGRAAAAASVPIAVGQRLLVRRLTC
jgi:hypothetical protein